VKRGSHAVREGRTRVASDTSLQQKHTGISAQVRTHGKNALDCRNRRRRARSAPPRALSGMKTTGLNCGR
jgi:hypothetical protein